MAEFDHGFKMIANTTNRELARVAGVACQLHPLESTLPKTIELLADRAFQAKRGRERFVRYFEFYTTWDRNAPWDILAKAGLLSQRARLATVCLVFVLLPRGYRPQAGRFRLEALGDTTQEVRFREVCLWQVVPQDWWQGVPGLMALLPLCRHGREPHQAIRHAAELIEQTVAGEVDRADHLVLLDIFGGLAYPRLDVARIIGRDKMKESRFVQEVEIERLRTDLLKLVTSRYGKDVAAELSPAVNAVAKVAPLERLFDQALSGIALDEFRSSVEMAGGK
jgi:hypothetical protein